MTYSNSVSVVLENVTLDHVRVGKPYLPQFASATDKPQWSVMARAEQGTEAFDQLLDLKEAGATIHHEMVEDVSFLTINLRQYVEDTRGRAKAITVCDSDLNVMSEEEASKVGNGSKGSVAFRYFAYANNHGTGITTRLDSVQVTELVEFTPETPEERVKRLFG